MKSIKNLTAVILSAMILILSACGGSSSSDNQATNSPSELRGGIKGTVTIKGMTDAGGCLITAEREIGGKTASVVKLTDKSPFNLKKAENNSTFSIKTGSDGTYEISSMPEGIYTVTAKKEHTLGAVIKNVKVTASKAVTVLDIVLTATGSISGSVLLNGSSSGVYGTFVYVEGTSYVAGTSSTGAFTITDVPIGTYDLVVYHSSYETQTIAGIVVTAATDTPVGSFDLVKTSEFPVITNVAASPVVIYRGNTVNLSVSAYDPDGDALSYTWTCAAGTFDDSVSQTPVWTAPEIPGLYIISVVINDGINSVSADVLVNVIAEITNLNVTTDMETVTLSWEEPGIVFDHIEIIWTPDGITVQTVEPGIKTYIATGLETGQVYLFTVRSVDRSGYITTELSVNARPSKPGAPADAIYIKTAEGMYNVRDNLAGYYVLVRNVILSDYSAGEGWLPIGVSGAEFTGTFDGNGHQISELTINRASNSYYQGLFGVTGNTCEIKDLGIIGGKVNGHIYVGSLVGINKGSVINCYATVNVTGRYHVGGLIGLNHGMTVDNCYTMGTVSVTDTIGAAGAANTFNCGGMIGTNNGGTVSNCYTTCVVSVNGPFAGRSSTYEAGGLICFTNGGTVSNCYALGAVTVSGNVTGNNNEFNVGDLVGFSNGGTVSSCYAKGAVTVIGTVTGTSNEYNAGGLLGFSNGGTINKCYATGDITVNSAANNYYNLGGLLGTSNGATVNYSYYDRTTSGMSDTGKGTPKTTAEMKTLTTFNDGDADGTEDDWDFTTIWNIDAAHIINSGYPYLIDNPPAN